MNCFCFFVLAGVVNRSREELVNSFDVWMQSRTHSAVPVVASELEGMQRSASAAPGGIQRKSSKLAFQRAHSQRYERLTRINQFNASKK